MLELKMISGLMCTELVVASFSVSVFDRLSISKFILTIVSQIWLGFAWGVMYCMLECVTIPSPRFTKSYVFYYYLQPDRYQVFFNNSITLISLRLAAFTQLWCKFFYSHIFLVLTYFR
jgi:hypothetical protein